MNAYPLTLAGAELSCRGTGALHWPAEGLLVVSDLHLGKAGRIARGGGVLLPPYETRDTLARLEADIAATGATTVLCLGDSFDDTAAAGALDEDEQLWLTRLMAGRRWIWIAGNHDPVPTDLGGTHLVELTLPPITFRHIPRPGPLAGGAEISGHYHPKATLSAKGRAVTRACFLADNARIVMPAYGTYTGGLRAHRPELTRLMGAGALAVLTGQVPQAIPMPGRADPAGA